jgi:hypothetical protein
MVLVTRIDEGEKECGSKQSLSRPVRGSVGAMDPSKGFQKSLDFIVVGKGSYLFSCSA